MERRLNRGQQGDLGEASAIEWLTSRGALVLIPFGDSPDFDLVAQVDDRLFRIQVKTTTQETRTASGRQRYPVSLVTCGGNQSWTGIAKEIDSMTIDYLFILTGSGRRWLIPVGALDSGRNIRLGGPKYSGYEIEPGRRISENVYGRAAPLKLTQPGEYPRGQRMAAVNRPAQSFAGSTPASPIASPRRVNPTNYERKPGQRGEAVINQKRRVTIPQRPFFEAGFENGGRVRVRAVGARQDAHRANRAPRLGPRAG